jgi:hypothetical protein
LVAAAEQAAVQAETRVSASVRLMAILPQGRQGSNIVEGTAIA